jgi:hypothetical protein
MKQRIRNLLIAAALIFNGGLAMVPAAVSAADCPTGTTQLKCDACEGVNTLNGTGGSTCDPNAGTKVEDIITGVINVLSIIVGFAAVLMLIVGGLKFITANGDSGAISSARSTITYSLIGLVVVFAAQILVHFVIRKVS